MPLTTYTKCRNSLKNTNCRNWHKKFRSWRALFLLFLSKSSSLSCSATLELGPENAFFCQTARRVPRGHSEARSFHPQNSALSSSLRKWKRQVPTITPTHLVTLMLFFPFPPTVVAEGTALLSEPWENSRTLWMRRETRFHRGLWERHQYPGDKAMIINTAFQAATFPWLLSSLFQLVSKPGWRQLPPGQVTIRTPAKRPKE